MSFSVFSIFSLDPFAPFLLKLSFFFSLLQLQLASRQDKNMSFLGPKDSSQSFELNSKTHQVQILYFSIMDLFQ